MAGLLRPEHRSALTRLPLAPADIESLRLNTKHRARGFGTGTHLRRRLGRSLEFHDFRDYVPGDDARAIDWRRSVARKGRLSLDPRDLVIKTFEAEERTALAVAVDTRPSMFLPEGHEKIAFGLWTARILARLLSRTGDILLLHALFAPPPNAPSIISAEHGQAADHWASKVLDRHPRDEEEWHRSPPMGTAPLIERLSPTSILVIVSDLHFGATDDHAGERAEFRRMVRDAQAAFREVLLVVLDSWPHERELVAGTPRRLRGLEGHHWDEVPREPSAEQLDATHKRLLEHRRRVQQDLQSGGLRKVVWSWPTPPLTDPQAVARAFRHRFLECPELADLFRHPNRR